MTAWSAFYPDVLPELPGAPLPMVDHYLRNATIDFCERSKVYVVDLAAFDAVASQMAYALTMPADTDLADIVSVLFSGNPITPKSQSYLETKYGDWMAEAGTPEHYLQQAIGTLLIVPAPDVAESAAIKVKVAVKPQTDAAGIVDWIDAKYRMAIVAGTKSRMMAMPGKAWTNLEHALIYAGVFEDAINKATVAANTGFVRSRPRFNGGFC